MVDNYIINVNLCTTKPIKIEQIDNSMYYIYNKQIDGYNIKFNDRILVKDQISHYFNILKSYINLICYLSHKLRGFFC